MKLTSTIASIILFAACTTAIAGPSIWIPMNSQLFLLSAYESQQAHLMATYNEKPPSIQVGVFQFQTHLCKTSKLANAIEISPIKINDQLVKFKASCYHGNQVNLPTTNSGEKYLMEVIGRGKPIRMEIDRKILNFNPEDFEDVRKKLLEADSAI